VSRTLFLSETFLPATVVMAVIALEGCAGAGTFGLSSLPDAKSASARTYASYCMSCHALPHPGRLTAAGWVRIYPVMEKHMLDRGKTLPNEDQRQAILRYLQTHAR
jgi:hypothetical protein